MEEYLKQALEIVKAQASVRIMTEDEILSMIQKLAKDIQNVAEDDGKSIESPGIDLDPKKALKEKSVTCLECGKTFKILTKRHLAVHNLTPAEYREKYGYRKNAPLVCKSLQRERRKKMQSMKLWERRKKQ